MKKNRINIISLWMMLLLFLGAFSFASCSDDDSTGGTPQITGVKILTSDTTNFSYDSTYSKASAGTMLAIMGTDLSNVTKVLVNGQSVYVNPTMNTDHSVIVTVPSEEDGFKLSAFDSSIKDEIEVQTTHGTVVYAFKITAPGPQLQRLDAKYPRNTGDTLLLNGLNLVDIEKIYITDTQSATLDTTVWTNVPGNKTDITDYWNIKQDHHENASTASYETTSIVGATVPANAPDSGAIVIECAAGTTYLTYSRLPGKPIIKTISSDMPQLGETLVITGREFVQIDNITYGDVTLTPNDYTISATKDTIYIPFKTIPSSTTGTTLTITNPAASATVSNFYDKSTILTTFDNDDAIDNGWGPNAKYVDAGTADGKYAHIDVATEYQNWWGTMVFFRKDWNGNNFSLSDNIPSNATADHIYLAYNILDNGDYNNGKFWGFLRYEILDYSNNILSTYDNFDWDSYADGIGKYPDGPVGQNLDGTAPKAQWHRAVVPLSKFSAYKGKTMAEIRTIGLGQFRIQDINESTISGKIDVKIDNVRVIYIP